MATASVGQKLQELIGKAAPTDLAEIDQEIEAKRAAIEAQTKTLRQDLAGLVMVRKLVAARLGANAPPTRGSGRRRRAAPAEANGSASAGRGEMLLARRKRIAALLAVRGPLAPMAIAAECEVPSGSITAVLDCEWFERDPSRGTVRITALGRKEAGL